MSFLEIAAIMIVLAACLHACYTDTRYKRISNLDTYGLVLLGLVCQGIFAYLGVTSWGHTIWLVLGSLSIAFVMYYLGIWSPGDSKLFWGVSVALPPTLYRSFSYWRYPPFIIAVNTFVPFFLAMTFVILIKTTWQQKLQVIKRILAPGFLWRFGLSLLSFTGISTLLGLLLPLHLDYFSGVIVFVCLYSLMDRFVPQDRHLLLLLPFSLVSIFLFAHDVQHFLSTIAVTAFLFLTLRFFVAGLGDYLFVREVDVRSLEKGAVPASIIIQDAKGRFSSRELSFTSFVSLVSRPRGAKVILDIAPEGISDGKLEELKVLANQGRFSAFGNKVKVQESMPFAPIILAGVALTIVSRGVFLERLMEFAK